jgi:ELWxxDGT repeat protein
VGTRLVADVNPEGASHPRSMVAFAGRVFFLADTPQGRELWRSDGTPEGTERVLDLHEPDTGVSLARAGGALFVLVSSASDVQVWRSDGTEAGAVRVLELPMRLQRFQAAGRNLFLVTRDAAGGQEMWAVGGDGETEAVRVLDMATSPDLVLFPAGDHVVFPLEDDQGREPWGSDGTPEGTRRIADLCPGACGSLAFFAGTYGGRAVFAADDGASGLEPWLTDGTAAGTFRLGDLCPGACAGGFVQVQELGGWLMLLSASRVWISDGTRDGAWSAGDLATAPETLVALPDRILFAKGWGGDVVALLGHLPVTAPAPLPGGWLESPRVPGFRFKVRIDGQTPGRLEPSCMARTLCVSGAMPGRSEVFVRWPSLVKLTTSTVEVWAIQTATGNLRYYRLESTGPTGSTLDGKLDREGFESAPGTLASAVGEAKAPKPPQPPGRWISYPTVPGFRVQARLTADGQSRLLSKAACAADTFCLSGAVPGQTELLVRVTGLRPNGYYWPMLARFTPATLEVWIEQRKTGKVRYYRLNPPPAGSSQLDGLFDRLGFKR